MTSPTEEQDDNLTKTRQSSWVEIILATSTLLRFLVLVVLVFDAGLFLYLPISTPEERRYIFSAQILLLLMLVGVVVSIALYRPYLLGIVDPYSRQFARLLGRKFFDALDPYLSNLEAKAVDEALQYWQEALHFDRDEFNNSSERKFASLFGEALLSNARNLLKRSPPPGAL